MKSPRPKPADFRSLIAAFAKGDAAPAKRQPPTNIRAISRKPKGNSK